MAGEHGASGGPHPGWVSYGPSTNLHVPAHALVTVTIQQYDSGEAITNPYFAQVHGTVGGRWPSTARRPQAIDPEHVGHTFTIHAAPGNQDPLFVSVPLPAVADDAPTDAATGYPTSPHDHHVLVRHARAGHLRLELRIPVRRRLLREVRGPHEHAGLHVRIADRRMTATGIERRAAR